MKTHLQLPIITSCMVALLFAEAALSQEPDRRPQTAAATSTAPLMKAIVYHEFGSPDVLRLEEIGKPVPTDDPVLGLE